MEVSGIFQSLESLSVADTDVAQPVELDPGSNGLVKQKPTIFNKAD
ncbi:MAG TPA: hypothetical protein V6D14_33080 [Coleofasciculaceae cyanobacterium]